VSIEALTALLASRTDVEIVDSNLLSNRPWIFNDESAYHTWRSLVAKELKVPAENVWIVGSAALGYSLSPYKPGRPFQIGGGTQSVSSDIDIAFVDTELFTDAWNIIVQFDRTRALSSAEDTRTRIRTDVYWGLVSQHSLPTNTGPARRVLTAVGIAGRTRPLRGHQIRCRVYRRLEDLRAYHIDSLRKLRLEIRT
jgi:hypothetical protein